MEGAGTVIMLTRLNGEQFALNCDLIERIEESPDTVLTLVDGKHIMVSERLSEIIDSIRLDRATVLAIAQDVANAVDSPAGPSGPNVISMNPRR
jgi:flagellar protein FlbD